MNRTKLAHLSHFTDNLWNSVWYRLMDNIQTYGTSTLFRSKALNVASALSSLSFSRCNELLPPISHFMSTLVTLTPEISSHSFIPIYTNRCTHKPVVVMNQPALFFGVNFHHLVANKKSSATHTKDFCEKMCQSPDFNELFFWNCHI